MLKFIFISLLALNGGLFAYRQGYLETLLPEGREPARMGNQLNPERIRLAPARVPAPAATAAAAPVSSTPAAVAVEAPSTATTLAAAPPAPEPVTGAAAVAANNPKSVSCTEVGNFDPADAKRFEARLAGLAMGDRLGRRNIQEAPRHMVYIPSQLDKEGADKKAAELRRLGIKDFYVIQDNSDMRWGISLGIFKTEEAARSHLATLSQKGVRSAKMGPYSVTSAKVAFQLRDLDPRTRASFDKIKADFPVQEVRTCELAG